MTKRSTPKVTAPEAAPTATAPKAPTAPTVTAQVAALVADPDAAAKVAALVRPLSASARKALVLSLVADATFMTAPTAAAVLAAVTTAPSGPDPEALVAAKVAAVLSDAAALLTAAGLKWPTEAPTPTADQLTAASGLLEKVRAGKPAGTRDQYRRELSELVAAKATVLTATVGGTVHTAKVTADAVTVGPDTFGDLSAAAKALVGTDRNGWQFWKAPDGRTAGTVVDQARAAKAPTA